MREGFRQELRDLKREVASILSDVSVTTRKAVTSLVEGDVDLAMEVIGGDDEFDRRCLGIEEHSLEVIATQGPVARDLRLLYSLIYMSLHLERMADLAVNIAKAGKRTATRRGPQTLYELIQAQGNLVYRVLDATGEAFEKSDLDLARKQKPEMRHYLPEGIEAILFVEMEGEDEETLRRAFDGVRSAIVEQEPLARGLAIAQSAADMDLFTKVRSISGPILNKVQGSRKPRAFIEDGPFQPDFAFQPFAEILLNGEIQVIRKGPTPGTVRRVRNLKCPVIHFDGGEIDTLFGSSRDLFRLNLSDSDLRFLFHRIGGEAGLGQFHRGGTDRIGKQRQNRSLFFRAGG